MFDDVCRVMDLKKKITSRAMRRTFQDLAREANIDSLVQRSICGHATEEMSHHYTGASAGPPAPTCPSTAV